MLTTRGGTSATRSAAMNGADHLQTLAYLAEDLGLVRYTGYDEGSRERWVTVDDGRPVIASDIVEIYGDGLLWKATQEAYPCATAA
jgi:hypothetical protein